MTNAELFNAIHAQFPTLEEHTPPTPGIRPEELQIRVQAPLIRDVCLFLRDEVRLRFDFLTFLTAVDWTRENRFEVVYHLFSFPHRYKLMLKVFLSRENPELPSVTEVWPGADWQEREVYDLYGIKFTGHPYLKRILLWEGYPGWPLRKDYVHTPDRYDSGAEIGIAKAPEAETSSHG